MNGLFYSPSLQVPGAGLPVARMFNFDSIRQLDDPMDRSRL